MNDGRERREGMDAAIAERLLRGEEVEESDDVIVDLAKVLAAAAEPLGGRPEDARAALTHFRTERDNRYGRGGRSIARRAHSAVVISGAAAAVFALGGVVIAAQVDAFPHPFGSSSSTRGPSPSAPVASRSADLPRTHLTPRPAASTPSRPTAESTDRVNGTARTSAPPSPSPSRPAPTKSASTVADLKGLCVAYVRSAKRTDALGASAQERLDQAAGGSDRVSAYCAQLTGIAAVGQGMSSITHLALPTDRGK